MNKKVCKISEVDFSVNISPVCLFAVVVFVIFKYPKKKKSKTMTITQAHYSRILVICAFIKMKGTIEEATKQQEEKNKTSNSVDENEIFGSNHFRAFAVSKQRIVFFFFFFLNWNSKKKKLCIYRLVERRAYIHTHTSKHAHSHK